jgi:hypothetical protein
LLAPGKNGTDGASVYHKAIADAATEGLAPSGARRDARMIAGRQTRARRLCDFGGMRDKNGVHELHGAALALKRTSAAG